VRLADASREKATPWLRLELLPRGVLKGLVLDRAGQPAAGARVVFSEASIDPADPRARVPPALIADSLGRFRVEVDALFSFVHAERDGQSSPDELFHVMPGKTEEIELRFTGAFAVTGVVLGPDRKPMESVLVGVAGWELHVDEATTDAAGRFRLELNRPCHAVLLAKKEGLVAEEPVVAEPSDAQPMVDVVLSLVEPTTISGKVQWSDGKPVAGQMIDAEASSPDDATATEDETAFASSLPAGFAMTDSEGRFRIEGVHPKHAIDLTCVGTPEDVGRVELKAVPAGTEDALLVFKRIAPGSNRLGGRVLDAGTGNPVARFEWSTSNDRISFKGDRHATVDDIAGRFEIGDLDPGAPCFVSIAADGYPETRFGPYTPSAEADVELRLPRYASLAVLVTDESGVPQPNARVQLMPGKVRGRDVMYVNLQSRLTGRDGRLDWEDLESGTMTAEAVLGDSRASRQPVKLAPGSRTSLTLTLRMPEKAGALEILAQKADGTPWGGTEARVVVEPSGSAAGTDLGAVFQESTRADGSLRFSGLPPGECIVYLTESFYAVPVEHVVVKDGETTHLTLKAPK
jgi:hypothetical protein